ncbi:DUF1015 domain-containing protein [Clostridium pasteurianum]|uniref:SpoOJ/ParA/ParB/repB family protein n=1 Tax=Clostridium pasteurianum BC1 TaxID=86416 RepID=R4K651_CLOPA|nr:DUF1015 family protein [Clostridium pasteurianum]AGK95130.1 hypothetical protein Clopa_0019 [Clostridium pasteurianum BC1]
MVKIKAFNALRPQNRFVEKVAALPYDVMNYEEAKSMAKGNPYSFLHVDRAEIDFNEVIDPYNAKVYEKAKDNLNNLINKNIFIKDDKPNIYIYRQIMNGRVQTGIVCCTAIDDYINGFIKKHEHTREDKEKDRIKHVDSCNANTGPIFLTYKKNIEINNIIDNETKNSPLYNFNTEDGITHIAWVIEKEEIIQKLTILFEKIDSLYIADGHHRAAAAVKVGIERRKENVNYKNEKFNYFLSVLYPDKELKIFDYNRVVKDLNGLTLEKLLNDISENFEIDKLDDKTPFKPSEKHTFGMYVENSWYKLKAKNGTFSDKDAVESLDVSILQNNLLSPVLGINEPRKDKRIDFVGGIRGLDGLVERVRTDMKIAFSLYPTTIDELMRIADEGKVMPPKSTWFEPKIRSGIFIHTLN